MASGSGKDQDDIQDPVHGQGEDEESNAAAAAAATAAEPRPPAPLVAHVQEQAHDRPGDGGESPSAAAAAAGEEEEDEAAAAAAAERKGKKVVAPSPPSSAGSSPPILIPAVPVTGAGESSSVAAADGVRRAAVSWREPLEADVLEVPELLNPIDLEDVFHTMVQELKAVRGLDWRWAEEEAMKQQFVKQPTVWPEHRKKTSLWSKVKGDMINMLLDRIGRLMRHSSRNSTVTRPHVDHQTIPMTGIIEHYTLLHLVAAKGMIFHSNALLLRRAYSEFRPVFGDGVCFYMSFIFLYLQEQVLDRPDTHEEHRLLAAVKGVARQHARLGWTSDFSSCRKAFKKLIKKVMRWKRHSRWKRVPSTSSYSKQKLLEFFNGYGTTEDFFAFLRLAAAIWICSHSEEYEPRVSELREYYTLKDWCFREVIKQRVFTDHVQITAVVTALGVPPTPYPVVFVSGAGESSSVAPADSFWSVKVRNFDRRWAEAEGIKKCKVKAGRVLLLVTLCCIPSLAMGDRHFSKDELAGGLEDFQHIRNELRHLEPFPEMGVWYEAQELFARMIVGVGMMRPRSRSLSPVGLRFLMWVALVVVLFVMACGAARLGQPTPAPLPRLAADMAQAGSQITHPAVYGVVLLVAAVIVMIGIRAAYRYALP